VAGQLFSSEYPVFLQKQKTDLVKILLKVVLNTITTHGNLEFEEKKTTRINKYHVVLFKPIVLINDM
jgi:hypothetical protein